MKVSERFCPYCKSPAMGNPCWWNRGGDWPCIGLEEERQFNEAMRQDAIRIWTGVGAFTLAALSIALIGWVII